MPTRNVVLSERREHLIQTLVESGRYQDASDVVSEGLRLVERREHDEVAKLAALRGAAEAGMDAFARGAFRELSDKAALRAYFDEMADRVI